MSFAALSDFGAQFTPKRIGGGSATAAGTGDNTEVTGTSIDLSGYTSGSILIVYTTALTDEKTLSFGVKRQESSDNSTFDTAEVIQALTVAETSDGGGTVTGVVKIDLNFEGLKRYLKINITPDLNATGTDTVIWQALLIRGGARELPAA